MTLHRIYHEELKAVSASSVSNSNGGLYVEEQDIHRTWNVNTWYGEPVITAEDDTYKDSIIHNVSGSVSFLDEKSIVSMIKMSFPL